MKVQSLQDLLVEELKDLYSAETMLLKALPRMARAATNPELKAGLEEHLEQTRGQKERLERIFEELGQKPKAKTCEGMKGIIEEGEAQLKVEAEDACMDAALIASAQKAEHYEMAAYGTVRTWAQTLGLEEVARLLQQTLDEEAETDKKLTQLAVSNVNAMAAAGEEEEEEEGDLEESGRTGRRAFASTGEDDEEGDEEREEIESAMEEEEEDKAQEFAHARASRGRTGNPTTTGRGDAGSRNPGAKPTRRSISRRERKS